MDARDVRGVARGMAVLLLGAAVGAGAAVAFLASREDPLPDAVAWMRGARRVPGPVGVRQRGRADCGPAALAQAARTLGVPAPYPDPESPLRPGLRGCRMDELATEAGRYGLSARLSRRDPARPEAVEPPALLHLRAGHYVVLEGPAAAGAYRLQDPSLGALEIPAATLAAQWSGWTLELTLPQGSRP